VAASNKRSAAHEISNSPLPLLRASAAIAPNRLLGAGTRASVVYLTVQMSAHFSILHTSGMVSHIDVLTLKMKLTQR